MRCITETNSGHDTNTFPSVQFSPVAQSCWTLCDPMNCSMPGLPVHHQLPDMWYILIFSILISSFKKMLVKFIHDLLLSCNLQFEKHCPRHSKSWSDKK